MLRTIRFQLDKVFPIPHSLRDDPRIDSPGKILGINLAQLFMQYYFDCYPAGPPKPDPSRFEYLDLISDEVEFRFHAGVTYASTVKKRAISTELGQAFCRLLLHDHFGIVYFAHMRDVLDCPTHAAFNGMKITRVSKGDIPDYLCAKNVTAPRIAEAKGRYDSIGFSTAEFQEWRSQFSRIRVADRNSAPIRIKGFIVGTRFATNDDSPRINTTSLIEDPYTEGALLLSDEDAVHLGRLTLAMHYGRVFDKIGLAVLGSALRNGYTLTRQLSFQTPVWSCGSQPFAGAEYVGGFYRTDQGPGPLFTERGWQQTLELGTGHLVFVGLERGIAIKVAAAARGDLQELDKIDLVEPKGNWSSEFGWLLDGSVLAPAQHFVPIGFQQL